MCNLPGLGIEPVSPVLPDGFLTTGPPEKFREQILEAGVETGSQEGESSLGHPGCPGFIYLPFGARANRILTQTGNTPGERATLEPAESSGAAIRKKAPSTSS